MLAVALVSLLLVVFSSIAILQVEQVPDANIQTPEHALWWAFVTVTTVGYEDKYPVTTEGRIICRGVRWRSLFDAGRRGRRASLCAYLHFRASRGWHRRVPD